MQTGKAILAAHASEPENTPYGVKREATDYPDSACTCGEGAQVTDPDCPVCNRKPDSASTGKVTYEQAAYRAR